MDIHKINPSEWLDNEENFSKVIESQSVRDEIPLLNVIKFENLGNLKLVKFRGMIQDMHSPEYYLERFEVVNKVTNESYSVQGKYNKNMTVKDDEHINFNASNITSERQTFVVISVPAINTWVHFIEDKLKVQIPKTVPENIPSNKRLYFETMDSEEAVGTSSSYNLQNKKICNNSSKQVENRSVSSMPNDIFPLPTSKKVNQVYHIKLYNHQDKLKINDVCEFVGFLDVDPSPNTNCDYEEMDTDAVTCFVPKIHCIYFHKLKHNNPLVNEEVGAKNKEKFNTLRKDLLLVLTQLLFGDELAAEYLLLHLISDVYMRKDGLALGKLSLNISNIPNISNLDYPVELYKFIETLVPKSFYLPMTLENLNDLMFVPKKDYDSNYLSSGLLQLSNNTHFVLDEIKLTSGKLNEAGLNNIKAVSSAIKHQTVSYDFKYYPLEFECDIPFLILSEGKSILHSDVHIVLQPDTMCIDTFKEIVTASEHFLKPDILNDIRKYLTLARLSEYTITEHVEAFVQREFVKMREHRSSATVDDLHNMLILTRLLSISKGNTTLDEESWNRASEMEDKRRNRIKN